ncbi:hypothetical protein TNCV_996021 [Trichonephila clavipes]|nr:hypothetical protein TNCV_996021 [Trichonephila clavipes]
MVSREKRSLTSTDEATSVLEADISIVIQDVERKTQRGLTRPRRIKLKLRGKNKKLIPSNNLDRLYWKEQGQKVTQNEQTIGCKKIQIELGAKARKERERV